MKAKALGIYTGQEAKVFLVSVYKKEAYLDLDFDAINLHSCLNQNLPKDVSVCDVVEMEERH